MQLTRFASMMMHSTSPRPHHLVASCMGMLLSASTMAVTLEGFETPVLAEKSLTYSPVGSAWVFGGTTGRGIQRNGSQWGAKAAPQGRQTAFLQGGNAKMSQKVYLVAGNYQVSFYASRLPSQPNTVNPIQVRVNGNPIGAPIAPTSAEFIKYTTSSFPLNTPGEFTVELSSTNGAPGDIATFVDAVAVTAVGTQEAMVIDIMPADTEGTIRNDIGHQTLGSGFEYTKAQMRMTMEGIDGTTPALGTAIGSLQLGMLRFPNGTPGVNYFWDKPSYSYGSKGDALTLATLTPTEVVNYANRWQMDRLFEVNTDSFLAYVPAENKLVHAYVKKMQDGRAVLDSAGKPIIDENGLKSAVTNAVDWVKWDKDQNYNTVYWEVGNEDWARWSGTQYADIFYAFQDGLKKQRSDIKLLAQGLANDYNGNTPKTWLSALTNRLGAKVNTVHAYSVHQYLSTDKYLDADTTLTRRKLQTADMLGQVVEGEAIRNVRSLLGKDDPNAPTRNWEIWMTEYNIDQPMAQGGTATLQDMGHALVIADWTGKLLEQKVDRLFMLSLDDHPAWAIVQYEHDGFSRNNPGMTASGNAYTAFRQFGKTMLRSTVAHNPVMTAKNGKPYPKLGVYPSITEDGKEMKIIVINRDLDQPATVNLNNLPGGRKFANGMYQFKSLSASLLTDTNTGTNQAVSWSNPAYANQSATTGIVNQKLAPASVNLFIVPLAP